MEDIAITSELEFREKKNSIFIFHNSNMDILKCTIKWFSY